MKKMCLHDLSVVSQVLSYQSIAIPIPKILSDINGVYRCRNPLV